MSLSDTPHLRTETRGAQFTRVPDLPTLKREYTMHGIEKEKKVHGVTFGTKRHSIAHEAAGGGVLLSSSRLFAASACSLSMTRW